MSKEINEFKDEHVIKLQGKDYLPVAPRVVMFRAEHPSYSILTETREIAGDTYMFAAVVNESGYTLATAHKRVRKDGKGPAAQWPLETAETGAIGRALALCGYGTLSGDLDEGDELADAPVESPKKKSSKKSPVSSWEDKLDAVKTKAEYDELYPKVIAHLGSIDSKTDEYDFITAAGKRAAKRVGA